MKIANSTRHPDLQGAISGLYGDVLQGWAMDSNQPDERLVIEICIDGACVAMVRADQFQPSAETGDQFHGFAVKLRESWLFQARHISARVANQPYWLANDIQLPAAPAKEPAPVATQVWHTGGLKISGWAWDHQAPTRHVGITVLEEGKVVAQATCNLKHQALAYRDTHDHGFELDLPWSLADGKAHTLHVESDLGHPLSGSPITLCCWPEGLEGLLKIHREQSPEPALLDLLDEMAREQAMRAPKSAGFQHYAQWFKAFQKAGPLNPQVCDSRVGVLLLTDGDEQKEAASMASLREQRHAPAHVLTISSDNILPALQTLLGNGCESILPLHAGDHLPPHALDQLQALLIGGAAWGYGDCDRDGPQGERTLPWLKPVWDLDLFMGADLFSPGALFGTAIIRDAVDLLTPSDGLQWLDWHYLIAAIALVTESQNARVAHLPQVLYHRHHSAPASPEQSRPSMERHQATAWLSNCLAPGAITLPVAGFPALLQTRWPLPGSLPRVSLIVPTRDQVALLRTCIEGLMTNTDYPNLEIIVVDNQSSEPNALAYLASLPARGVKVLPHPYPFNYSTINNRAVEHGTGEIIGLVNNDIEIIEAGWLKEMVSQLLRPSVGAVGAKLLWPNKMVQHGGVIVGINGLAAHTGNTLYERDAGYLGFNQLTRQQSAVTAACLVMHKSVFRSIGGLDAERFPIAFNDVDLCLRIRQSNLRILWTPFAKLVHAESASRGKDIKPEQQARAKREQQHFIKQWSERGQHDPFYNPGLSIDYLSGPYGALNFPPPPCIPRYQQKSPDTISGKV